MDRDVERSFAALQLQEDPGPRRRPVPVRQRVRRLSDVLREQHANGEELVARHPQRRPSGQFNGIRENGQTQSGSGQLQLQIYQNPVRSQQSSSQHALNNINSAPNERQGRRKSRRTSIILIEHGGSGSQSPNQVEILPTVFKIQQPQAQQSHGQQVQNQQLQNLPVRFVTAPPQQPVVPISEHLQLTPIGFSQEPVIHHPPPNFFYPQHLQPMEPQFYQQPFVDFAPINGIFDNAGHFIPQPFIVNGANGIPIQRECIPQPIPQPNIPIQHNFMPPPIQYTVPPPVLPPYQDARNMYASSNLPDFAPELNQNHQNPAPSQRIFLSDSNGGNRIENPGGLNGEPHESGRNFRRRDDKKPQLVDGQLIKSALCRNMLAHGRCDYGDRCHFAHDIEELTLKPASDNFKTVECMEHSTTGQCPYGYKCHYFHEGEDPYMRKINDNRSVADFVAAKEEFQRAKEASERPAGEPAPSRDDPGPARENSEPSFNFTG